MLRLEGCTVDLATGRVTRADGEVVLTQRERTLLAWLVEHPSSDVSRAELLRSVFGFSDQAVTRAVDSTVRRLRTKIEIEPARPRHLLTSFGTGYRFEPVRSTEEATGVPAERPSRWLLLGPRRVERDLGLVRGPEGELPPLTSTERAMLTVLADADGVVPIEDLVRRVWGHNARGRRLVVSTVHRLRRKIEPDPEVPRYLSTVRGSGLRLVSDRPPSGATVATVAVVHLEREPDGRDLALAAADLEVRARAEGGQQAADRTSHVFDDPAAARRWADAVSAAHPAWAIGLHKGRLLWWVDPVNGRTVCAGPAVLRARELAARTPAGTVALDEVAGTLPDPDAFVGRVRECAQVVEALSRTAIVTLVGAPGVGKTRLAREVAARWPAATVVCDLRGGEVVRALGGALGLTLPPREPERTIGRALAARGRILVVLDPNASVDRDLLAAWSTGAPEASFLSTGKRAVGVPGEQVIEVEPLPLDEASALLSTRARARGRPMPDADRIAALTGGVPLAVELAAGRVGDVGAAPEDGASLDGALVRAFAALSELEGGVLAQLSVFVGRFTAAAAGGVCTLPPGDRIEDVLGRLVDRALVAPRGDRFELLGPVRAFARVGLGDTAREVAARHRRWFARWARRLDRAGRYTEIGPAMDDLLAAARSAIAAGDVEVATDAVLSVDSVLRHVGPVEEAVELLEAVDALEPPWPLRAPVVRTLAEVYRISGRPEKGIAIAHRWIPHARAVRDEWTLRWLLGRLAFCLRDRGMPDDAVGHAEEALAIARASGQPRAIAESLEALAYVCSSTGATDRAEPYLREAIAIDPDRSGSRWMNLASLLSEGGRNDEAEACCVEALAQLQQDGNLRIEAYVRATQSLLALNRGRPEEALELTRLARALHRRIGSHRSEGLMAAREGEILARLGRAEEGRAAAEAGVRIHRQLGLRTAEAQSTYDLGYVLSRLDAREEAAAVLAASEQIARETGQRVVEGGAMAERALLRPQEPASRQLAEAALAIGRELGSEALLGVAWRAIALTSSDPAEALRALDEAERVSLSRDPLEVGLARCQRVRVLRALGRHDEVERALDAARALTGTGDRVRREVEALSAGLDDLDDPVAG